jgi:hypothetical protein
MQECALLEVVRAVAAIELFLTVLEALSPRFKRYLPLGGTHLSQIGVLFACLIVGIEFSALVGQFFEGWP